MANTQNLNAPNNPPFTPPAGALNPTGLPVNQAQAYLFCTQADATSLLPLYQAAMLRQGLTQMQGQELQVVDLVASGAMPAFSNLPPGVSCYGINAVLQSPANPDIVLSDIAGNMVKRLTCPDLAQMDRVNAGQKPVLMLQILSYPPASPGGPPTALAQGYFEGV